MTWKQKKDSREREGEHAEGRRHKIKNEKINMNQVGW